MSQLNSHLNERMTKARLDSWLSSKLSSFCSHGEKIKAEKFKFPSRTKTWVSCQTKNRPHLRSFIEKLKEQKHSKQDGCFEHKHCWLRTAITNFHNVTTDNQDQCSPIATHLVLTLHPANSLSKNELTQESWEHMVREKQTTRDKESNPRHSVTRKFWQPSHYHKSHHRYKLVPMTVLGSKQRSKWH